MIVKDVMKKSVITVEPETTVTEAKELMNKNNISKLPVVKGGKLVGIITKNDLLQAGPSLATTLDMYEISYLLSKLNVKKIMTTKVFSVSPDDVVEEAGGVDLQYFRLLVAFDQEKSSAAKKKTFAEMRALANDNSFALVGEDQYDYYGSWLNPVLREMAPRLNGATPAQMAGELVFESDAAHVKNSLKLLEKNGFLEKDEQGRYIQCNRSVTTGNIDVTSLAIREMHRQMGELGVQSLDHVPVKERDVSGLTIGISETAYEKIIKEIADFRRRISSIVMEDTGEERVYRLNVQLFPLTNTLPKEERHD